MSQMGFVKYKYLTHFSQPVHNRIIYRSINDHKLCRLLEIGIGDAERAMNMIAVARRASPDVEIRYTGIDLFEGRAPNTDGLSLKAAHTLLRQTDAKIQLVPGDPYSALARIANSMRDTDLIVVSSDQANSLEAAWTYFPRMLHPGSLVIQEQGEGSQISTKKLDVALIEQLASARPRKAAA